MRMVQPRLVFKGQHSQRMTSCRAELMHRLAAEIDHQDSLCIGRQASQSLPSVNQGTQAPGIQISSITPSMLLMGDWSSCTQRSSSFLRV